jgi:hypothetical protein
MTFAGVVTFGLLSDNPTVAPAVEVKVTVQVDGPAALKLLGLQLSALRAAGGGVTVIEPLPPVEGIEKLSDAPVFMRLTVTEPAALPES